MYKLASLKRNLDNGKLYKKYKQNSTNIMKYCYRTVEYKGGKFSMHFR